jgi:hypothetical protein
VLKALERHGCIGSFALAIVEDEPRVSYTRASLARLGGGRSLRLWCEGGCHRTYLEQAVGELDRWLGRARHRRTLHCAPI